MPTAEEILRKEGYQDIGERIDDWVGIPFTLERYELRPTRYGEILRMYIEDMAGVKHTIGTWSQRLKAQVKHLEPHLPVECTIYRVGRSYTFLSPGS